MPLKHRQLQNKVQITGEPFNQSPQFVLRYIVQSLKGFLLFSTTPLIYFSPLFVLSCFCLFVCMGQVVASSLLVNKLRVAPPQTRGAQNEAILASITTYFCAATRRDTMHGTRILSVALAGC